MDRFTPLGVNLSGQKGSGFTVSVIPFAQPDLPQANHRNQPAVARPSVGTTANPTIQPEAPPRFTVSTVAPQQAQNGVTTTEGFLSSTTNPALWSTDPSVLFDDPFEIIPSGTMSNTRKQNAFVRLTMYVTLGIGLVKSNFKPLVVVLIAIFIVFVWRKAKAGKEKLTLPGVTGFAGIWTPANSGNTWTEGFEVKKKMGT